VDAEMVILETHGCAVSQLERAGNRVSVVGTLV